MQGHSVAHAHAVQVSESRHQCVARGAVYLEVLFGQQPCQQCAVLAGNSKDQCRLTHAVLALCAVSIAIMYASCICRAKLAELNACARASPRAAAALATS